MSNPRIEEAFATVPREPFAGPGPWSVLVTGPWRAGSKQSDYVQTPDSDPTFLYQDVLIALDPGCGINIGEPNLHARCLDVCAPQQGETVVQVGAGSGHYTAILANLVGQAGQVHAFEIDPDLAERAKLNLRPWSWAEVHARLGVVEGLPSADVVYVNAGLTQLSWAWIEALRPGGRLLYPLQSVNTFGGMLLIERPLRSGKARPARFISRASSSPCQARQDHEIGRRLAKAFAGGRWDTVHSIRLDGKPDDTCWFHGGEWWLSTATV